jgi:hypothetical protein
LEHKVKQAKTEAVFRDVNERIAASAERFDAGDEDPRIEKVVERHRRFAVVKKVEQVVARTVRRLDPRAEPA